MDKDFIKRLMDILPYEITYILNKISLYEKEHLQEIRLRINMPLCLIVQGIAVFVDVNGHTFTKPSDKSFNIKPKLLEDCFLSLCSYSVQSHQDELQSGYFTANCGFRVGVGGNVTQSEYGKKMYRDIYSLNIRIPKQVYNICSPIINSIDIMSGLLIVGKPSSGKTTFLRELARTLSNGMWGKSYKVTIIDERYEICGAYNNSIAFDIGYNTDIISGEEKTSAIEKAVRVLSPEIIICDEVGSMEEAVEISKGIQNGVTFISTIHGSYDNINNLKILQLLDTDAFKNIIFLSNPQTPSIIDKIITKEEYLNEINRFSITV